MAPRTLKLVVAYDGTAFVGWQRQAEGVSVQGLLEEALSRIEGHGVAVTGAGRTDAGVHALAQVASCVIEHAIPATDLRRALNAILPPEVRVRGVEEVPLGFHARYAARGKVYRYAILNAEAASPFLHRYVWHVLPPLNTDAMAAAARLLVGSHDFSAFQSTGGSAKTTVRTVFSSTVTTATSAETLGAWLESADEQTGRRLVLYEVAGDGFLRHMVRAVVGSLVEVGTGRRDPAWIAQLLREGARDAAGPTAPACGLWLVRVEY